MTTNTTERDLNLLVPKLPTRAEVTFGLSLSKASARQHNYPSFRP